MSESILSQDLTSVPSTEKAGPAPGVVLPSTPAAAYNGNERTGRAGHSESSHHRFTFCQYWPSARWWATYMDGELLDVYPSRDFAEGYVNYMNGRAA